MSLKYDIQEMPQISTAVQHSSAGPQALFCSCYGPCLFYLRAAEPAPTSLHATLGLLPYYRKPPVRSQWIMLSPSLIHLMSFTSSALSLFQTTGKFLPLPVMNNFRGVFLPSRAARYLQIALFHFITILLIMLLQKGQR